MTKEEFYSTNPPYLHIIEASASVVTDFGWSLASNSLARVVVRFLRGKKMRTTASLYDEFSAALQFPYYFGENWNAFSDCITDFGWLSGDCYILVVTDAEQVLADEPEQLESLIGILEEAGQEWGISVNTSESWGHHGVGFHTILQCSERNKEEVTRRLQGIGAVFHESRI